MYVVLNLVAILLAIGGLYLSLGRLKQVGITAGPTTTIAILLIGSLILRKISDFFPLVMLLIMLLCMFEIRMIRNRKFALSVAPLNVVLWIYAAIGMVFGSYPLGLQPTDAHLRNDSFLLIAALLQIVEIGMFRQGAQGTTAKRRKDKEQLEPWIVIMGFGGLVILAILLTFGVAEFLLYFPKP